MYDRLVAAHQHFANGSRFSAAAVAAIVGHIFTQLSAPLCCTIVLDASTAPDVNELLLLLSCPTAPRTAWHLVNETTIATRVSAALLILSTSARIEALQKTVFETRLDEQSIEHGRHPVGTLVLITRRALLAATPSANWHPFAGTRGIRGVAIVQEEPDDDAADRSPTIGVWHDAQSESDAAADIAAAAFVQHTQRYLGHVSVTIPRRVSHIRYLVPYNFADLFVVRRRSDGVRFKCGYWLLVLRSLVELLSEHRLAFADMVDLWGSIGDASILPVESIGGERWLYYPDTGFDEVIHAKKYVRIIIAH